MRHYEKELFGSDIVEAGVQEPVAGSEQRNYVADGDNRPEPTVLGTRTTGTRAPWREYWFTIARAVATRSTCPRAQVGAVLVYNNRIVSTGYNGAPSGQPHCDDVGCKMVRGHCKRAIHAERNLLTNALFSIGPLTKKLEVYCSLQPCTSCYQELIEWGIQPERIHWEEDYGNR